MNLSTQRFSRPGFDAVSWQWLTTGALAAMLGLLAGQAAMASDFQRYPAPVGQPWAERHVELQVWREPHGQYEPRLPHRQREQVLIGDHALRLQQAQHDRIHRYIDEAQRTEFHRAQQLQLQSQQPQVGLRQPELVGHQAMREQAQRQYQSDERVRRQLEQSGHVQPPPVQHTHPSHRGSWHR